MNDSLTTIKVRKRFIQILLDPMNTKLQLNWLNIGELRVYLQEKWALVPGENPRLVPVPCPVPSDRY